MSPAVPVVSPVEAAPVRSVRIEIPARTRGSEDPPVLRIEAPDASPWYREALERISSLTALAAGWNGYDAHEVKGDMVIDAVKFLAKIAFPGIAAPSITPLADGGLQVEWHRGGLDIEVAFSDQDPGIYVADRQGDEVELPLADAVSAITNYWPRLQES